MMLSHRTIASLDKLAMHGLKTGFAGRTDEVTKLAVVPDMSGMTHTRAVMLSVALVECRMVLFIHHGLDAACRAHFANMHGKELSQLDDRAFLDALCESGSQTCGTFNRDLGRVFTHLGMSTPALVDSQCARHLGLLPHAHQRHYVIELNGQVQFHSTLCVCPSTPLDFDLDPLVDLADSGELEMF
jgi:hypothetical protein